MIAKLGSTRIRIERLQDGTQKFYPEVRCWWGWGPMRERDLQHKMHDVVRNSLSIAEDYLDRYHHIMRQIKEERLNSKVVSKTFKKYP